MLRTRTVLLYEWRNELYNVLHGNVQEVERDLKEVEESMEVESKKMSLVCGAVVQKSIKLLEDARSAAKQCRNRAEKVEKLIDETRDGAAEQNEARTNVQIKVVVEMLRDIRDTLISKRASMIEPLREIASEFLSLLFT